MWLKEGVVNATASNALAFPRLIELNRGPTLDVDGHKTKAVARREQLTVKNFVPILQHFPQTLAEIAIIRVDFINVVWRRSVHGASSVLLFVSLTLRRAYGIPRFVPRIATPAFQPQIHCAKFFAFHNARRRDLHSNRRAVFASNNLNDACSHAVEEVLIFVDWHWHWHKSRQADSDQQVDEYAAFHFIDLRAGMMKPHVSTNASASSSIALGFRAACSWFKYTWANSCATVKSTSCCDCSSRLGAR